MKRVEITFNKYQKELEKLNSQLEKAKAMYEKKLTKAKKFGVENWTREDHDEFARNCETTPNGFFINKKDIDKNTAWWDMVCQEDRIKELEDAITRAEKRLEKSEKEVNEYRARLNDLEGIKAKEEFMRKEFEDEKKEWAKDGIELYDRYSGKTPSGKFFIIYANNYGFTDRSLHCFSLRIDGNVIFTSGEFWRAYKIIKKN